MVCSDEKSSKPRAKEAALSAHATVALPLLNSGLERELRQSPLKTACQNSHASSSKPFPGLEHFRWAEEPMRGMFNSWLAWADIALIGCRW